MSRRIGHRLSLLICGFLLAAGGALATGPAGASAAPPAATGTAAGLRLVVTRTSLLGSHTFYEQTYRGLPVLGGYLVEHRDRRGRITAVDDGRQPVPAAFPVTAAVSATTALAATGRVGAARSERLAVLPGTAARLVWSVVSSTAGGSVGTLVDARSGRILRSTSLVRRDIGHGQVFDPNPVVTLSDESLTDRHDTNYAALRPAYREVIMTNLDNSGFLRGDYVRIVARNQPAAYSAAHRYDYNRSDNRFEQVMSYYHLTKAQRYIRSLGFNDVNNESQTVLPDNFTGDNSFYDPANDTITYGTGGVDDAEDAEVIWHEYGHAIQDAQVPGFGSSEQAGAIGEGFGDYWAVTMSEPVSPKRQLACVADWDSTSYTSGPIHCLRRVDLNLTVADIDGEVHDDGQIWSRALWDIHRALGRRTTDRIILEAQFSYRPNTSFAAAARVTVATARALYGTHAAAVARTAFADRGIL